MQSNSAPPAHGGTLPQRVQRCECTRNARTSRLLQQARIPARYEHCELSNFHIDERHCTAAQYRSLSDAKLFAGKFVEEYPVEKAGLLLIGTAGAGKTHLAVSVMKELIISKGVPCVFYDYRELLKEIQNSYNPSVSSTEMSILRPVFETEVLVLDELGAIKPSGWVGDTVSLILNSRYNNMRTTILTTNFLNLPEATSSQNVSLLTSDREAAERAARKETLGDRIGERMRSRLHEMCKVVNIEAEDFRQRVRRASFA